MGTFLTRLDTRVRTTLPAPQNGLNLQHMVGAVIYVRVSDPRQAENLRARLKVDQRFEEVPTDQ